MRLTSRDLNVHLGRASLVISVIGLVATTAVFAGTPAESVAIAVLCAVLGLVLHALFLHARSWTSQFSFAQDAALEGEGYIDVFRTAQRSLLLMHVDEDVPGTELLRLYRELLDRGVQIRRLAVPDQTEESWRRSFGSHESLREREIPADRGDLVRFSFAVVDESCVVVALPCYAAIDEEAYSPEFILRHLIKMKGKDVSAAFSSLHEQIWRRSEPVNTVSGPPEPPPLESERSALPRAPARPDRLSPKKGS